MKLDKENVPRGLHELIPLAERFGITDDGEREQFITAATSEERAALKQAVRLFDDALMEWLAGPEASGSSYSPEYLAFSALVMAADYV